jgi:hypothetical protein
LPVDAVTDPVERQLLDRQAVRLHRAWRAFVRTQASPETIAEMMALFMRRDTKRILAVIDHSIATLATTWDTAFSDVARNTAHRINAKIGKAAPTVSATFTPGDPRAAALMARNRLRFITDLTAEQRRATTAALTEGQRRGWSTERTARAVSDSIGLGPKEQRDVANYRAGLLMQPSGLDRGTSFADDLEPLSPEQVESRVARYAGKLRDKRAVTIARTEALMVTSAAQDMALRESLADAGIDRRKVFKVWNTTRDGRERPEHAERDGMRIPIDQEFAPGILKPGDGGPKESINCRCVLQIQFEE